MLRALQARVIAFRVNSMKLSTKYTLMRKSRDRYSDIKVLMSPIAPVVYYAKPVQIRAKNRIVATRTCINNGNGRIFFNSVRSVVVNGRATCVAIAREMSPVKITDRDYQGENSRPRDRGNPTVPTRCRGYCTHSEDTSHLNESKHIQSSLYYL